MRACAKVALARAVLGVLVLVATLCGVLVSLAILSEGIDNSLTECDRLSRMNEATCTVLSVGSWQYNSNPHGWTPLWTVTPWFERPPLPEYCASSYPNYERYPRPNSQFVIEDENVRYGWGLAEGEAQKRHPIGSSAKCIIGSRNPDPYNRFNSSTIGPYYGRWATAADNLAPADSQRSRLTASITSFSLIGGLSALIVLFTCFWHPEDDPDEEEADAEEDVPENKNKKKELFKSNINTDDKDKMFSPYIKNKDVVPI